MSSDILRCMDRVTNFIILRAFDNLEENKSEKGIGHELATVPQAPAPLASQKILIFGEERHIVFI